MRLLSLLRGALVVFAGIAATLAVAPAAQAAYSPTPVGPSWVPDGPVQAVVTDGSTVYVGGAFTGGVAALTGDTGRLIWRGHANKAVRALALSSDRSHLLIGGAFTAVDGATHRKLASVFTGNGAVDPTFRGAAGGTVRDLVVVGDTAYFGGLFTGHAGMAQQGLGAVNAVTGKLVPAFAASTNGKVYALATNGSRLFFGGEFTAVDGRARNQLASVRLPGHSLDEWVPARSCSNCNRNWDIALGATTVYAVGGNAGAVYAVDAFTGAQRWRVTANGDAQAVTLASDGRLYVGGHFATIAGQDRKILTDLNPNSGAVGSFNARFIKTWPGIWALDSSGSRLYVAGHFTAAGPKVNGLNAHPYFAMFPTT